MFGNLCFAVSVMEAELVCISNLWMWSEM